MTPRVELGTGTKLGYHAGLGVTILPWALHEVAVLCLLKSPKEQGLAVLANLVYSLQPSC